MAIFEWRKFNFFDLKLQADEGKVAEAVKDAEISCATSGRGQHIICDTSGFIHAFYKSWEYNSFKGHDSPILLCALSTQNNLLVTISTEENGELPIYKVWNLAKITKTSGAPCLRSVKAALQKPTALGVTENGQYMAIGFELGGVSLYRGDITRDRSKNMKSLSSGTSPVTGLAFRQHGKNTHLFVCSDSGVLVYNIQGKDKETKVVLDKKYVPTRCCALQSYRGAGDTHFMVGKDDAIYCYTVDGRGPCYALDGQKVIIDWYRTHLLTVTRSTKTLSSQKEFTLTVIDIQNKFIVYTTPIDAVAGILIEFGTCYILTKDKNVYLLTEKDLQNKLNLLFKKNLYDIAIRIAKNQQYDAEGLAGIFRQYGDHLYLKGDFAGAVDQYIKTIGFLEPSYVIRRFLDSRHIYFLTDYLEALHKQGQATADHTTLLLNCFTRLELTDKLKDFLSNDKNPDIIFDLDVAIKVCRNASIDLALTLAKRNQKHDYCTSILMEEMQAYEEALDYISKLPLHDAEIGLKKYGTLLMEYCPDRTTDLLKGFCTNFRQGTTDSIILLETPDDNSERANPANFIQLFFKHSEKLIEFLEYIVANPINCSKEIYNTLIELYLHKWKEDKNVKTRLMEILKTYDDVYDKDHILVLCRMFEFWPGILWIYEEDKLYHLILRYYLKNRDYTNLLEFCKKLSSSQPTLWLQALTGLRKDVTAPPHLLLQVLNVIGAEKLQSPLQVLNCLAVEEGPNIPHVREYFMQIFQKESEYVKKEEADVENLRNGLKTLKERIENMRSNCIEFRSTLCATCQRPLTMPAVYFLCQHSFHQDCIRSYSDNEKECSSCHARNLQLTEALRAQNESRNQHDAFHNRLNRSHEPFSVVSEYFGRGLFNNILIVDEQESQEINQNTIQPFKVNATPAGGLVESKLRLGEGNTIGGIIQPKAEGRLRVDEASKYSPNIETNVSQPLKMNAVSSTGLGESKLRLGEGNSKAGIIQAKAEGRVRVDEASKFSSSIEPYVSQISGNDYDSKKSNLRQSRKPFQKSDNSLSKNISAVQKVRNIEYDESKNPFAEDDDSKGVGNPFEEYDNNLNPFA